MPPSPTVSIDMNAVIAGRQRWISIGLQAGVWTVLGLLSASQVYLGLLSEGRPISWERALLWQMPGWYLWGALTPLVLYLGRRFRIERQRWMSRLLIHLSASISLVLLHLAFLVWVSSRMGLTGARPFSFSKVYLVFASSFFHFELLAYWAILGIGYAFEYHRKYREREMAAMQLERQLTQAQLQALKMQLHPHFLFNTLHAIAVLVRKQENQAAVRMLAGLSDLLRYALERVETQEVTLKQELEFIERYLEIEQVRFQDRLTVRWQIAPETLDAQVPSLILQPLVENAIRHGIAARAAAGVIEISARREQDKLRIQVRDDGPGLPADWAAAHRGGVGIANTRARLQQLYGAEYQFELRNVERAEGSGMAARLIIPFRLLSAQTNGRKRTDGLLRKVESARP